MKLKPIKFDWIKKDEKNVFGFIAQDTVDVVPCAVEQVKEPCDLNCECCQMKRINCPCPKDDTYFMDYTKIIPINTKAIQELNAKITDLQAEIDNLKAQINN